VKMYISQREALKILNPNMYRELLLVDGIVDFSSNTYLTFIKEEITCNIVPTNMATKYLS
ncbi:MAG: hypothetical protein J6I97_04445, partial [Agathobacter sp.]|nr:hypothetical protein [Agathobacter sp.]